jgi:hypothetical protein
MPMRAARAICAFPTSPSARAGNYRTGYAGALDQIVTTTGPSSSYNHLAMIRSSGTIKLFVNGTSEGGSFAASDDFTLGDGYMSLGAAKFDLGNYQVTGLLDEFRISVGTDRGWFSGFTPPSAAYSADATARSMGLVMG